MIKCTECPRSLVQIQIKEIVTKNILPSDADFFYTLGIWPMSKCCQRGTAAATINQSMLAFCLTKECKTRMIWAKQKLLDLSDFSCGAGVSYLNRIGKICSASCACPEQMIFRAIRMPASPMLKKKKKNRSESEYNHREMTRWIYIGNETSSSRLN